MSGTYLRNCTSSAEDARHPYTHDEDLLWSLWWWIKDVLRYEQLSRLYRYIINNFKLSSDQYNWRTRPITRLPYRTKILFLNERCEKIHHVRISYRIVRYGTKLVFVRTSALRRRSDHRSFIHSTYNTLCQSTRTRTTTVCGRLSFHTARYDTYK